jgi:hypothetical protein
MSAFESPLAACAHTHVLHPLSSLLSRGRSGAPAPESARGGCACSPGDPEPWAGPAKARRAGARKDRTRVARAFRASQPPRRGEPACGAPLTRRVRLGVRVAWLRVPTGVPAGARRSKYRAAARRWCAPRARCGGATRPDTGSLQRRSGAPNPRCRSPTRAPFGAGRGQRCSAGSTAGSAAGAAARAVRARERRSQSGRGCC